MLFPIYSFVLKIVGLCYLVPWVLVWIGLMFNPSYRAAHAGSHWLTAIGSAWGSLWTAAFTAMGVVTIVFTVLERVPEKAQLFEHWDPMKLPRVRDPHRIPRASSTFEVAANLVVLLWWSAKMGALLVVNQAGARPAHPAMAHLLLELPAALAGDDRPRRSELDTSLLDP